MTYSEGKTSTKEIASCYFLTEETLPSEWDMKTELDHPEV